MAKLLILTEGDLPREVELQDFNTLGRHPSQSVQLLDRLVSKAHAEIAKDGNEYIIRDLGSRNGSFVNQRQVDGVMKLDHGDEISLGSTRLVYQLSSPEPDILKSVTIAPSTIQSNLHSTLAHEKSAEFLPEADVLDVDAIRVDYERLRLAHQLQQDLAMELEMDILLGKIFDYVFSTLQVERGVVLLYNSKEELEPRLVRRRDDPSGVNALEAGDDIKISQTILNKVIEDKTAILSSDALVDDRFGGAQSIIMQGIRSTMCVPLLAHDKILGVLHVDNLLATGAFSERDLTILQGLATQAGLAIENSFLVERVQEEALTRQNFERLLSPNLVEKVVSGELAIEKGGEVREVTVLFSDIRGFTELSEHYEASEIVTMLNDYFEHMVDAVFQHSGTVDKFMGDGMMALWGAPVGTGNDAIKAVRSAMSMQQVLLGINERRVAGNYPPIQIGIGIDTGQIVAGYIGSSKTMSYTVVGSGVNRAARLCAKAAPGQILISRDTLNLVDKEILYNSLEPVRLKGFADLVSCFEVTGLVDETAKGFRGTETDQHDTLK